MISYICNDNRHHLNQYFGANDTILTIVVRCEWNTVQVLERDCTAWRRGKRRRDNTLDVLVKGVHDVQPMVSMVINVKNP